MVDAHDLRTGTQLQGDDLWVAVGLLASIVELAQDDRDVTMAREALERLVGATPDKRGAAILDWWLVTRAGRRSQGPAFELERVVEAPLLDVMNTLLEQSRSSGAPSLPGLRSRRRLAESLEEFARELHHEQGKVGSQGVTWEDIESIYRPVFDELSNGGQPAAPPHAAPLRHAASSHSAMRSV